MFSSCGGSSFSACPDRFLFTVGVIGVGLLAIATLSDSAGYAFAETFGWEQGLDSKFTAAGAFYAVVVLSTLTGVALDVAHVNPVKSLRWTARCAAFTSNQVRSAQPWSGNLRFPQDPKGP